MPAKLPKGGLSPATPPLTALPLPGGDNTAATDASLSAAFTTVLGSRAARDHLVGDKKAGAKGLAQLRKSGQLHDAPRAPSAPPARTGPRTGHR